MKEAGRRSINIKLRIAFQFRHFLQADVRPASDDPHMRLKVDKIEKHNFSGKLFMTMTMTMT